MTELCIFKSNTKYDLILRQCVWFFILWLRFCIVLYIVVAETLIPATVLNHLHMQEEFNVFMFSCHDANPAFLITAASCQKGQTCIVEQPQDVSWIVLATGVSISSTRHGSVDGFKCDREQNVTRCVEQENKSQQDAQRRPSSCSLKYWVYLTDTRTLLHLLSDFYHQRQRILV